MLDAASVPLRRGFTDRILYPGPSESFVAHEVFKDDRQVVVWRIAVGDNQAKSVTGCAKQNMETYVVI